MTGQTLQKPFQLSKKASLAALLGTLIEYYDYSLYGFCARNIAASFFPSSEEGLGILWSLGVFALGHLAKPLGSLVFGHLGDHFGRRISLQLTIIGIALPTCLIGLIPTYHEIGVAATAIIVLCRSLQGFFLGGEYDGAAIYMLESHGHVKSGYASAIVRSSGVAGLLLGAILVAACRNVSPDYWRLPFLASLPFALLTLYLRRFMLETPEFQHYLSQKTTDSPPAKALRTVLRDAAARILLSAFVFGSFSGCLQFLVVFFKSYLPLVCSLPETIIEGAHIVTVAATGVSMLLTAFYADRFGARRLIALAFAAATIFLGILAAGFFYTQPWLILGSQIMLAFSLAPTNALMHGLIFRIFNVEYRYRAMSISHNLGSMALSGSTPFFAMSLFTWTGSPLAPVFYLSVMIGSAWSAFLYLEKQSFPDDKVCGAVASLS